PDFFMVVGHPKRMAHNHFCYLCQTLTPSGDGMRQAGDDPAMAMSWSGEVAWQAVFCISCDTVKPWPTER
ncbi:hypothetical protein, partial [Polymorphospora rubra]|uniref:hypothetical protein n=1 Tax=Polymorphospora rubra TaxID=338584 RepID=UPI0031D068A5